MTIKQFAGLDKPHQYEIVKHSATFLLARKAPGLSVLLYQLYSFYIEVYYDTQASEVKAINCFTCTDKLEPYLRMVNVTEIHSLLRS